MGILDQEPGAKRRPGALETRAARSTCLFKATKPACCAARDIGHLRALKLEGRGWSGALLTFGGDLKEWGGGKGRGEFWGRPATAGGESGRPHAATRILDGGGRLTSRFVP